MSDKYYFDCINISHLMTQKRKTSLEFLDKQKVNKVAKTINSYRSNKG